MTVSGPWLGPTFRKYYFIVFPDSLPDSGLKIILVGETSSHLLHASVWMTVVSIGGSSVECPSNDNGCQSGQPGGSGT